MSRLGVPIYITETGVADQGDALRPQMIEGYMAAVEDIVRRGYDLRGIMYWSLVDNFGGCCSSSSSRGAWVWGGGGEGEGGGGARGVGRGRKDEGAGRGCKRSPHPPAAEWALGFAMRFGVYRWEQDGSQARIKRESAALLESWYRRLPASVAELWAQQRASGGGGAGGSDVETAAPALAGT